MKSKSSNINPSSCCGLLSSLKLQSDVFDWLILSEWLSLSDISETIIQFESTCRRIVLEELDASSLDKVLNKSADDSQDNRSTRTHTDMRKSMRNLSNEKVLPTTAIRTDDDDPPEIEEQGTTSITRVFKAVVLEDILKKSLKSSSEKKPNTAVTRSHDNDLTTAIRTNNADPPEIEKQGTTSTTRIFKAVVLEDFLKKSLKSSSEKKPNTTVTRIYNSDDSDEDDSSDTEEGRITRAGRVSASTLASDHCSNSSSSRNRSRLCRHSAKNEESIYQNDEKLEEDEKKKKVANCLPTHEATPGELTDESVANKFSLRTPIICLPRLDLDDAIKIYNRCALWTNALNPIVLLKRLELENLPSSWDSKSTTKQNGCTENNWKMRVQFAPKTKVKCRARKLTSQKKSSR